MSNQSQFTLYIQSGPQAGQTFTLVDGSQIIGRAAGSQIQINETTISKQHVRVTVQANGAFVEDLTSANGTYLNGQRVTTATWLKPGDSLRIGTNTVVEVRGAAGAPAAASTGRGRGLGVAVLVLLLLAGIGAATWFILQANPATQQPPPTTVAEQSTAPEEPIAAPAVDLVFTSDKTTVAAGECVTLRWQVKEAQEVRLDGEQVPDEGEREVCPQEVTKTYRLTALSQNGETQEESLTLTIPATPSPPAEVEITFTADATTVQAGECVNLRWLVENAQEVRLDNQKVSPAGTQQVCPAAPTNTYTLLVLPPEGDDIIDQTVTITVPPTPLSATATSPPSSTATSKPQVQVQNPIIDQFIADKNTLGQGECTTLRWTVRNVQNVRLDGTSVANQGSQRVCPTTVNNTFNLVVSGSGGGSVQSSLSISVSASTNNSGGQSTSGGSNSNSPLVLALGGQHRYEEPWGAPTGGDPCQAWENGEWDDENPNFRGFNVELKLTNNTDSKIADEWGEDLRFTTAGGGNPKPCYYIYEGMGPAPKGTTSVTFFTVVSKGDFVQTIELNHIGQTVRLCLDGGGGARPC